MTQTLFLSTVTREFGPLRQRLAKLLQRTKKVMVRHQDDFFQTGEKTLQMLADQVQKSHLVVHVIGTKPGWVPPEDQVETFLQHHTDFAPRFPQVAAAAQLGEISATQWEAWLALYFDKKLLSYQLPDLSANTSQQQHVQRLKDEERYPKSAKDFDGIYDEIIGSLVELGVLTEDDIRQPVSLPFPSMGDLFHGR